MCATSTKRILVGVDANKISEIAVQTAAELAVKLGATLELIHVVPPLTPCATKMIPVTPEAREAALSRGRVLLRERREYLPADLSVMETLAEGTPDDCIIARAGAGDAYMVVVGDHNRGRLASFLIGSTAEQVVRRAPCPVLVVRQRKASVRALASMADTNAQPLHIA